ncbi:MAG: hypothetical protein IKU03_04320 [Bacteroidales bacterium]|nr:hypothetical protein [Bacteroidales bacterium]
MNVTQELYKQFNYDTVLSPDQRYLEQMFGYCEVYNVHNTWQFFPDYEKFDTSAIDLDLDNKQWYRDNQWKSLFRLPPLAAGKNFRDFCVKSNKAAGLKICVICEICVK